VSSGGVHLMVNVTIKVLQATPWRRREKDCNFDVMFGDKWICDLFAMDEDGSFSALYFMS
jgi:hypothetical protein